jgi:hypothetical protein
MQWLHENRNSFQDQRVFYIHADISRYVEIIAQLPVKTVCRVYDQAELR